MTGISEISEQLGLMEGEVYVGLLPFVNTRLISMDYKSTLGGAVVHYDIPENLKIIKTTEGLGVVFK